MILRYFLKYRRPYLEGFLLLCATNALALTVPWLIKSAVEAMQHRAPPRVVGLLMLGILGAATAAAIVRTGSRLRILGASRRVQADVRSEFFAHLQTLPPSFFQRHRTGDILSRGVNDTLLLRSLFGPGMMNLCNTLVLYAATVTLLVRLDSRLAFWALLPFPPLLLAVQRYSRRVHRWSNLAQEQLAEISNKTQENLSGMMVVKAYCREREEERIFGELSAEYRRRNLRLARSRGAIVAVVGALGGIGTVLVLAVGGRHVLQGRLTLGEFVAFNAYLAQMAYPTLALGWIINVFQRGFGAAARLREILEITSDLPGDRLQEELPVLKPEIQIRDLTFAYPRDGTPSSREGALTGLSLDVSAGSTLSVVGEIGSGKSTLAAILCGLYPVEGGKVFIGGMDLTRIPTPALRRMVGIVPQDPLLFSTTIRDNILFARPGAGEEVLLDCSRAAGLLEEISAFPRGFDTLLGERGVTLSGGQRQRVALARALVLNPSILILDDAFSSVDSETESRIRRELGNRLKGKTIIQISHRVATAADARQVIVLHEGRVVEAGNPAELLQQDGPFSRMARRQQLERELESM